jgi:hypothetical protein
MKRAPISNFGAPTTMYEMEMTYWLEQAEAELNGLR